MGEVALCFRRGKPPPNLPLHDYPCRLGLPGRHTMHDHSDSYENGVTFVINGVDALANGFRSLSVHSTRS